jgi:hypothetical protein
VRALLASSSLTGTRRTFTTPPSIWWRAQQVKRRDAISYDGDIFGSTKGTTIEENRHGQTIQSIRTMSESSGNETIFKGGLSLFDDVERIVLEDSEVAVAIAWMRSQGCSTWPEGRRLEEVIIGRSANDAKP